MNDLSIIRQIPENLRPDEPPLMVIRRHPAVLIGPIILVGAGLIMANILYTVTRDGIVITFLMWPVLGLLVLNLIYKLIRWWGSYFVVSSKWVLLIAGTRKFASLHFDKVTDWDFRSSLSGRLLGYGSLHLKSLDDDDPLRVVGHIPWYTFQQIIASISSDNQQTNVEPGGSRVAVDTRQRFRVDRGPDSVEHEPNRLRRRKWVVLALVWLALAGLAGLAVAVAVEPHIQPLANSEFAIIMVTFAATGPIARGHWTGQDGDN